MAGMRRHSFAIGEHDFLLDGEPHRVISGALHYFRIHPDQWRDRIRMGRMMGLNTIETYVAWNEHSPEPGVFDTIGRLDLARFLREVQEEGLHAIVRPGPYICAEFDGGGFPAWLFRDPEVGVRTLEPRYMAAVTDYLRAVMDIVAPLQIDRGGPVILLQVENEYGAYGSDHAYLQALTDLFRETGATVPLTTVDQPEPAMLAAGNIPGLLATGSFGSRATERLAALRRQQPTGPLMCSEFWCGWFDHWGAHHHTTDAAASARELNDLLAAGASVNIYMLHGGTNFGLTNGANDKGVYQPTRLNRARRRRGAHRHLPGVRLEDPAARRRAAVAALSGRRCHRLRVAHAGRRGHRIRPRHRGRDLQRGDLGDRAARSGPPHRRRLRRRGLPPPPRIAIVSGTSEPVRPDAVRAGAVTLHDVAREAGVSLATASRALNGSARKVADSYRERVEAAAARLGYTANLSAQATARGTSAIIALLVADIADPYFGEIASGVARGADEEGLVVTVAITERDPAREVRLVRALRGQRPRGLILAASRASKDIAPDLSAELDQFAAAGGRVVALGTGSEVVRGVAIDNRGGAAELGAALAARGYRTAVVLAAAEGVVTSDDRVAGFADGFGAGGGEIGAVLRGGFTRESGHDLMAQALAAGVAPGTVVFGISDVVAIGALSALREAGRSVGDDVALAGFDDIPTGRDVTPALTTVRIPLEEVGYQALHAATDAEWEPAALRLEVLLRDSTPLRDAGA